MILYSLPAPGFSPNLYMHTERRKTRRKGSEVTILVILAGGGRVKKVTIMVTLAGGEGGGEGGTAKNNGLLTCSISVKISRLVTSCVYF
jgi:hypothetical protein